MTNETQMTKWEYKVFPDIHLPSMEKRRPCDVGSPIASCNDMEIELNNLGALGWEIVTFGMKEWSNGMKQTWWIFKRKVKQP